MTQLDYDITMCNLIMFPICDLHVKIGIESAIDNMDYESKCDLLTLKCNPDASKPESRSLLAIVYSEIQKAKGNLHATKTIS